MQKLEEAAVTRESITEGLPVYLLQYSRISSVRAGPVCAHSAV